MGLRQLIYRGNIRKSLWGVAFVFMLCGCAIEFFSSHGVGNVSSLNIETKLNNISNNAVALKSRWLLNEPVEKVLPSSPRTVNIFKNANASLYLLENDKVVKWWNDSFTEDITPVLSDTTQTLVNFNNKQILVRRTVKNNRTAALVVILTENNVVNSAIFDDQNIKLLPSSATKLFKSQNWHKINFGMSSFWVQASTSPHPPILAYALCWIGMLIILGLITFWLKRKANDSNALRVNFLGFLILILIRVLLYFCPFGIFNGAHFTNYFDDPVYQFCFSPVSLLINVLFILLQSYLYYSTLGNIQRQFGLQGNFKKSMFFLGTLVFRVVTLVYVHWAIVENIYNPEIDVNLFNIFSVNAAGVLLYISCGMYFVARLFQNNIIDTPNFARRYRIDVLYSIPLIILALWLLRDQLHGTWHIAIIYSLSFRAIGFLWGRLKKLTVFCIAVFITSLYITSLVSLETTTASEVVANEYVNVLTDGQPKKRLVNDKIFENYTYAFVSEYNISIASNNQTELLALLPYLRSDTVLMLGSHTHLIKPLKETALIVSYKHISALDILALMSYIYFFIFIVGLITASIFHIDFTAKPFFKQSIINQIQTMIVGVVIISVAAASIVSINYSIEGNKAADRKVINNLLQTVQNSIKNYETSDMHPIVWLQSWYNLSGRALTQNMAVYGGDGRIIVGHPNQFHTYLLESEAIVKINNDKKPYHAKLEPKQGRNYYTLYFPVHHYKQLFGYVVVSFLDPRQYDNSVPITEELLNLFIVVLFFVIWISLLINFLVTKPLKMISKALSTVKLMRKIPLQKSFSFNYEVNSVIAMYNDMIDFIKLNNIEIARIERQSAWQEMAKQVAHDISNPLTPIQLKVQILQRKIEQRSPDVAKSTDETLEMILEQLARINQVLTRFKELSYVGNFVAEEIDLVDVIKSEVYTYNQFHSVNVSFENKVQGPVLIYADSTQIARVIGNLCKNSIEALEGIDGGNVWVVLDKDDEVAKIEVIDNGTGVPEDIIDKLWEPSFTTKVKGSGLGLAICRRIVEEFDGKIEFKNNLTEGVTFTIIFPLV